jgi:hypothetical protein
MSHLELESGVSTVGGSDQSMAGYLLWSWARGFGDVLSMWMEVKRKKASLRMIIFVELWALQTISEQN